jgi:hypothetical protein
MIRLVLVALFCISLSLGSGYAVAWWRLTHRETKTDDKPQGLEQRKTRIINVPILADGQVQGYIVAQFIYTADGKALKELSAPPDTFILDEAFRLIYGEQKLDFRKLDRIDLGKLTTDIRERVARRMKSDVVKEIMLQDFNYVSRDDVRR